METIVGTSAHYSSLVNKEGLFLCLIFVHDDSQLVYF